jgi:hypothetical protein
MKKGAVLGIDVGFSKRRQTTCLCLLEWSNELVQLTFKKVGADVQARAVAISAMFCAPTHLAAVAIDGPLTGGLRQIPHYRAAEALLSRGVFQKRGKPGQTSSPIGQRLHQHATQFAKLLLGEAAKGQLSVARATHIEPIHEAAIVEAFPNQFLASLIDEDKLPVLHRDASDRYWERLAACDGFNKLLAVFLPNHRFGCRLTDIHDHDERAAAVCALTGLAVATEQAVGVGDPEDGDIFLASAELWGAARSGTRLWAEVALRENVAAVRGIPGARIANHLKARVRLHGRHWIS